MSGAFEEVADHYVIVVRKHRVPHLGYAIASLPLGGIPIVLWIIDSARDKWRYRFMILYGKGLRVEDSRLECGQACDAPAVAHIR